MEKNKINGLYYSLKQSFKNPLNKKHYTKRKSNLSVREKNFISIFPSDKIIKRKGYSFMEFNKAKILSDFQYSLLSLQERIAAFYHIVAPESKQDAVLEGIDLWRKILLKNKEDIHKAIFVKDYKNDSNNFNIRKDFRSNYKFAIDLCGNWPFEKMLMPYLHTLMPSEYGKFTLNEDSADNDRMLGWGNKISEERNINSNADFISINNNEVHYFELKNLMVEGLRSANFKVSNNPILNKDDDNHHVLFINFDGVGNTKTGKRKHKHNIRIDNISWNYIMEFHKNYPSQFGGYKQSYLLHFPGETKCCLSENKNERATIAKIGERDKCFIYEKDSLAEFSINYKKDIYPFIKTDNKNSIVIEVLKEIKQ